MADVVVFRPDEAWVGLAKLQSEPIVDVESVERRQAYHFHRDMFSVRLAYVRHPHFPQFLIPFSEYDDFVLQDKFNETLRVLTALGASSIRCSSHRQRSKHFGAKIAVGEGKAEVARKNERSSRFDYAFEGSGGSPSDPRPLRWPGEPGMEAAIEGVLRNGATSVRITVKRDESISTNADVPVRLQKLGVELGLHSVRGQVDTLDFDATFPPRGRTPRGR